MRYRKSSRKEYRPPLVCRYFVFIFLLTIVSIPGYFADAEDWPTYQHDNQRSGVTSEKLTLPLNAQWTLAPRQKPRAAWEGSPAPNDYWHFFKNLRPRSLFDQANYISAVSDSIFFGSSSDDIVSCRDMNSGEERWVFFTEGPVRFAPSLYEGKAYFGSDDGYAYCLNAQTGDLIWKYKPYPQNKRIIGNGRMISVCPIRTSVLIQNGAVYFCAGIFPLEGVYLCALNPDNGSKIWEKTLSDSPQGYLLSTLDNLFVPTGNTNPIVFSSTDGRKIGSYSNGRSGGTYALIVDDKIVSGPGYTEAGSDWLNTYDTDTRANVASFQGNHVIVTDKISFLHTDSRLTAIDREAYFSASTREAEMRRRSEEIRKQIKQMDVQTRSEKSPSLLDELTTLQSEMEKCVQAKQAAVLWSAMCAHPYSLIAAGNLLFAGGDNEAAAYSMTNGELLWKSAVTGRAYGLAAANGSLFVSTDQGTIHRFSSGAGVSHWIYY
ncbi:MAG: PQQ-binding-like beta-propeller repeat protein [Candidatus Omnitrophota bacterium]